MAWTNAPLVVYHGTDENSALHIARNGISLAACRPLADFGRGFYVTSSLHQAQQWANQKILRLSPPSSLRAAVLTFFLDRDLSADLDDHLTFVRGTNDFYDFCQYNRMGGPSHGRQIGILYDVVYGPVRAYPQLLVFADCDQICLLNQRALNCLGAPNGNPAYGTPFF